MVLILAIFIVSLSLNQSMGSEELIDVINLFLEKTCQIYPVVILFTNAIAHNDWLSFGLFMGFSMELTLIFILILSIFYNKTNSALLAVKAKNDYHLSELEISTRLMALYKNELQHFISIPIYITNTYIGALLLIVVSASSLFFDLGEISELVRIPNILSLARLFAPWLLALFSAISSTIAATISIEGKNRLIMGSLPVEMKTIWKAKIMVNLTYMIPAIFISAICLSVSLEMNVLEGIVLFLVSSLYAVFIATIGLLFNTQYPSYDWKNPERAVKQLVG